MSKTVHEFTTAIPVWSPTSRPGSCQSEPGAGQTPKISSTKVSDYVLESYVMTPKH